MKNIKVMSLAEMRGIKYIASVTILSLLFVAGGIFVMIYKNETVFDLTMALACILLGGISLFLLLRPGTTYVSGKSFWWARLTKEKQKNLYVYSLIFCIIMVIVIVTAGIWQSLGYVLGGIIVLFYSIASLKVHEDIDYTTNQAMEDLIGMDIDEKVCASYQNFDGENNTNAKGDNLLVVTNRKIFYAVHNGNVWMILKRSFEDLIKIGYYNGNSSGSESIFLIKFKDATSIKVKMDVLDKPTSNPNLFFKQFLNVLDAYVSGYDIVKNNSRRRVTIERSSIENSQSEISNQTNDGTRRINLELNEGIVSQMKIGESLCGNRTLEL